jgi:predicted  nucleic acid-binding Zn-ribbon protein
MASKTAQRIAIVSVVGIATLATTGGYDVLRAKQTLGEAQNTLSSAKQSLRSLSTSITHTESLLVSLETQMRSSETDLGRVDQELKSLEEQVRQTQQRRATLMADGARLAEEIKGHTGILQGLSKAKEAKEKELVVLVAKEEAELQALHRAKDTWFVTRLMKHG